LIFERIERAQHLSELAQGHDQGAFEIREGSNETSPPCIVASGSGRCRGAGPLADREGASLSDTAGADDRLFESKLNYNFLRDFVPIAGIFRVPNVMVANPSIPAKTVPEFIAYAKANPGKINVESPAAGTSSRLAGEASSLPRASAIPYSAGFPQIYATFQRDNLG